MAGGGSKKNELFSLLYHSLSKGYQLLGACHDMGKNNWTESDRQRILQPVLQWKAAFIASIAKYGFTRFAIDPSITKLFTRPKSSLTYQYWGSSPYVPQTNLTAAQNFALLSKGQFETVKAKTTATFNLQVDTLWDPAVHTQYHDYRKLARYAVGFVNGHVTPQDGGLNLPSFITRTVDKQISIGVDLGHRMGRINDWVVSIYFYNSTGNISGINYDKQQIIHYWPQLQRWVAQVDWAGQVQYLLDSLLPTKV